MQALVPICISQLHALELVKVFELLQSIFLGQDGCCLDSSSFGYFDKLDPRFPNHRLYKVVCQSDQWQRTL